MLAGTRDGLAVFPPPLFTAEALNTQRRNLERIVTSLILEGRDEAKATTRSVGSTLRHYFRVQKCPSFSLIQCESF
jgi:hypothetical protein